MSHRPRNAVIIIHTPDDWRPTSLDGLPPEFSQAEFYAKNLPLGKAVAIAEAINRYSIRPGNWSGRWAIVALSTKRFNTQLAAFRLSDADKETLAGSVEMALVPA